MTAEIVITTAAIAVTPRSAWSVSRRGTSVLAVGYGVYWLVRRYRRKAE